MKRVPVHLVAGPPGSGKLALIARLIAERDGWATLSPGGCPCCTGRVDLQIGLARLLRERRPERVLVALPDGAHAVASRRVLGERPLAQYIVLGREIVLPEDAGLAAAELAGG